MPDLDNDDKKRDDGYPWGHISSEGDWVALPKGPMLKAGYGPPPFDLIMPDGSTRHVVHQPGHGPGEKPAWAAHMAAPMPSAEVKDGKLYKLTARLRWTTYASGPSTLEQAWIADDGSIDWREIPVERQP